MTSGYLWILSPLIDARQPLSLQAVRLIQSNPNTSAVNLSLFERFGVRFGSGQIPKGNEGFQAGAQLGFRTRSRYSTT
jgi:hypothetical protein